MKQRTMPRSFAASSLAVAVLALSVVAMTPAHSSSQDATEQRIARIEKHLVPGIVVTGAPPQAATIADRMRVHNTPGVSVAVINGGVIEWARGYGVQEAGAAQPVPVTARTRFQAASISKPVAAMAALALVQDGRLVLDEDVNAKLKSWKVPVNNLTKKEPVTLRRLLSHSAGLTVHGFPGYAATAPMPTLVQILDGAKPANTSAIRVDILPGSEWRYSGGGYTVVQQMLVDVSGRSFPQFMDGAVLRPLGMSDSTYEQPLPASLRGVAASGHRENGQVVEGRYHTYPEMAAAGLWTTPTDLARFAIALQQAIAGTSNPVLSRATAREMLTVQKGSYGLGLSLSGTGHSARFGHGGSNEGFRCEMVAYLETGQGAVVMTNSDGGGMVAQELLRAVASEYGWPDYPKPKEKTIVTVDGATLSRYAGQYEVGGGTRVRVEVAGNRLRVIVGTEKIDFDAESTTKFFETSQGLELEFVAGADGAVTHLVVNGTKGRRLPGSRP